ncbi:MAG: ROK family protein, partial [Solirubrobacteraceae bacterium]
LERGEPGESHVVPTDVGSSEALLDQLVAAVDAVRGPDARAVGIGVPSVVEFATGRVRYSVNIPLADLPLRELLTDRIGLPVYVDNDASCAALSEAYIGEKLVASELVMYTVGTGVGGGVVLGGRLYRGHTGAAPEMGHQIIGMDLSDAVPDARDKFPQVGSLESLAAGRVLDRLAKEAGFESGKAAVAAAQDGDAEGARLVRIIGERLGIGIANAINVFDPAEVVIGGGVSAAGELLLGPAREVAARFTLHGVGTETTIRLARRGPEAGVVGAGLLAVQELEREE